MSGNVQEGSFKTGSSAISQFTEKTLGHFYFTLSLVSYRQKGEHIKFVWRIASNYVT